MDWKDQLQALRGDLKEPETPEPSSEIKAQDTKAKQTTPLKVVLDKKGRNGKIATIIEGFTINQREVEILARELKTKLGAGGSVREGEILIQGDRRQQIVDFLIAKGFKAK